MKTLVFKTYSDFLLREDKEVNGVSEQFAKGRPDYEKQNETNYGCWNCSGCSDCSRCSDCSGCYGCYDCSDCSRCSGCYGCYDCYGCYGCSDCYDCSDCSDCSDTQPVFDVPVIENIHQKVLEAVSKPGALNMDSWHSCETTHCRAGWVIHLAGEKGYALENQTSPVFAAMQIYHASNPTVNVPPTRFFDRPEKALEDMKRCAELEKQN